MSDSGSDKEGQALMEWVNPNSGGLPQLHKSPSAHSLRHFAGISIHHHVLLCYQPLWVNPNDNTTRVKVPAAPLPAAGHREVVGPRSENTAVSSVFPGPCRPICWQNLGTQLWAQCVCGQSLGTASPESAGPFSISGLFSVLPFLYCLCLYCAQKVPIKEKIPNTISLVTMGGAELCSIWRGSEVQRPQSTR